MKKETQSNLPQDAEGVLGAFKQDFGNISGIGEISIDNYHGGWEIRYDCPFIFDHRQLPSVFMGISVSVGDTPLNEMPQEFQVSDGNDDQYVWSHRRYQAFVKRCAGEIREKLNNPAMTPDEILDALSPIRGNFKAHEAQCLIWEELGQISPQQEIKTETSNV